MHGKDYKGSAKIHSGERRLVYITTSVSSRPFRDVLGGSEDCSGGASKLTVPQDSLDHIGSPIYSI